MRLTITWVLMFLPTLAFADMKKLTCIPRVYDDGSTSHSFSFVSLLDTNDFSKQNPEHELTYTDESSRDAGVTQRFGYSVSPSSISLRQCYRFIQEAYGDECMSNGVYWGTIWELNRESLIAVADNGREVSCTLEDFGASNKI